MFKSKAAKAAKGTKVNALFQSMKKDVSYIVGPLDKYLTELSASDSDRAIDINAPSSIGGCPRAIFYSRTQVEPDSNFIEPRTRRIFDNGHHMHDRLQGYLKDAGILLMDEVPVRSDTYNIQGHTDGIISIDDETGELGVLELKSMNDGNFSQLKEAKHDHVQQALIYLYCLEERRKGLREEYECNTLKFGKFRKERKVYYESLYTHLVDGRKFTAEEKLAHKVEQHKELDRMLFNCATPLTKVVIVYENKNTQDLKEFVIDSTESKNEDIIRSLLVMCTEVNEAVDEGIAPKRGGRNKSDPVCRWCAFTR